MSETKTGPEQLAETLQETGLDKKRKPLTFEEFFEVEKQAGWTPDNEAYKNLHYSLGQWIEKTFSPKLVIEIGSGSGALLEYFTRNAIHALGFDPCAPAQAYFAQRNPTSAHAYVVQHVKDVQLPENIDVLVSIEVWEHISDDELRLLLEQMKTHVKYFVFSSTPHSDPNDDIWGHINIKSEEEWLKLFAEYNFFLSKHKPSVTPWAITLKNTSL
jgi:2-polyprenyl-3-methyl-5-hydroxy-6-metoxy-1,4-benzoquinol methylase